MTMHTGIRRIFLITLALVACVVPTTHAFAAEPAMPAEDPARFIPVKEWAGTFKTGASSGGKREAAGGGTETYSSTIRVEGRFKMTPYVDPRNGPETVWRGTGEAHIYLTAKSFIQYKAETVTSTWDGDYVDTITVQMSNIDLEKGTYEFGMNIDLWQEQAHKGKAVKLKEVTVNRDGTRVRNDIVPGHGWANDGGAGFGGAQPLPRAGLVIDGKLTRNNDDFLSIDGSKWDSVWQITPVGPEYEEPLKAIAGGPYEVERGAIANLDGWKSTGKIRSYKWTFEPVDAKSEIPFNAGATKEGKRVPTQMLASVKATLTVSDGEKEDTDTAIVTVKARDYKTPFKHRDGENPHPNSKQPLYLERGQNAFAGGENCCALDNYGAAGSIHILHPGEASGSWHNRGYKTKQVKDANGPFDGVWFLDEYTMQVEREMFVNKYLLPDGREPLRGAGKFYDKNKELGHDPDAYLKAIREHELLHSELMQKSLATNDPGPKIEALASKDEGSIKTAADKEIKQSEDTIDKASADPLPHIGYKAKIAFPDASTGKYVTVEVEI